MKLQYKLRKTTWVRSQWLVCFFLSYFFLEENLVCMCCQMPMTFVGIVVAVLTSSLMVVDSCFFERKKRWFGRLLRVQNSTLSFWDVPRWSTEGCHLDVNRWNKSKEESSIRIRSRSLGFAILVVWERETKMGLFDGKNWRLDDGERDKSSIGECVE